MKKYMTYEEPLQGRIFTEKQMYEVYRDMADKKEYPDFECWFTDMLRSGVFEEVQAQAIQFATVTKNGVVQKVGKSTILQPKTNFKGGSIKWYEDKKKADK